MLHAALVRHLSTREAVVLAAVGVAVVGVLLTAAAVKRVLRRWS